METIIYLRSTEFTTEIMNRIKEFIGDKKEWDIKITVKESDFSYFTNYEDYIDKKDDESFSYGEDESSADGKQQDSTGQS